MARQRSEEVVRERSEESGQMRLFREQPEVVREQSKEVRDWREVARERSEEMVTE